MSRDDILSHVDESRREFLRQLIAGTAFAVPVIASFSIDGLSIGSAEAAHVSNAFACLASNSTLAEYVGPNRFTAHLWGAGTFHRAQIEFKVKGNDKIEYEVDLPSSMTGPFQWGISVPLPVLVPSTMEPVHGAQLRSPPMTPTPGNAIVILNSLKGVINNDTAFSQCNVFSLLEEMAAGHAQAFVLFAGPLIYGQIVPGG